LLISPEGNQPTAGISDFDSALDGHGQEDQALDSRLNVAAVSGVTERIMFPDEATNLEKREETTQKHISRQTRKTSTAKTDSGGRALKPAIGVEVEVADEENADDNEWGSDYGQMDEEILKWRKQ
jgi:hypothetical protein